MTTVRLYQVGHLAC